MKINKLILGLCLITENSTGRSALEAIKFEGDRAVACDGFRMLIIPVDNGNDAPAIPGLTAPTDPGECLIPGKFIADMVHQVKTKSRVPDTTKAWTVPAEDGWVKFLTSDGKTNTTKEVRKLEGQIYPDYKKILAENKAKKPVAKISVNPKLLLGMMDAIYRSGVRSRVTLTINGELDPILFSGLDYENKEVEGLLMPVRA
jgi:hypothetical protein